MRARDHPRSRARLRAIKHARRERRAPARALAGIGRHRAIDQHLAVDLVGAGERQLVKEKYPARVLENGAILQRELANIVFRCALAAAQYDKGVGHLAFQLVAEGHYAGLVHGRVALQQALQRRGGHISLISSVAGFRGLPQGLAYGPTKAALINLAETLYLDLRPEGIGVSVINPGFVETPLTEQNPFTMPALITPAQAAAEILRGWARGSFDIHFPKRFTLWLKLLRLLPYRDRKSVV